MRFFIAAISCMLLCSCNTSPTEQDRKFAESLDWDFYMSGRGTTWEYANNQVCSKSIYKSKIILQGKLKPADPAEYEKSRKNIAEMFEDIERGKQWPIKQREEYKLPFLNKMPKIDGDAGDWDKALVFYDEYPINSTDRVKSGAVWKMAWDKKYIYVFASFPDKKLVAASGKQIWHGDAFEAFICPELRYKNYWEIIVAPDGRVYDGMQQNSRWGGYVGNNDDSIKGLKKAVKRGKNHYSVELAVPWHDMPGYSRGNKPEQGQTINFILIRCNNGKQSSCRPILYGGHNIRGHLKAILD